MRWDRMEDDEVYVLDFLQLDDGMRLVKLRNADDEPHAQSVLQSNEYLGSNLKRWGLFSVSDHARLSNGESFVLEAHGGWLTAREYEYWRSGPEVKERLSPTEFEWVNGIPPRFPGY